MSCMQGLKGLSGLAATWLMVACRGGQWPWVTAALPLKRSRAPLLFLLCMWAGLLPPKTAFHLHN